MQNLLKTGIPLSTCCNLNFRELLKKEGHAYAVDALAKINDHIVVLHELKFGEEYFNIVHSEMRKNTNSLQDSAITSQGAAQYLQLAKERLELKEKDKMLSLIKADLVPNRADESEETSRTRYVPISGFLGLFLSLAYITGRYCWKLTKKQ